MSEGVVEKSCVHDVARHVNMLLFFIHFGSFGEPPEEGDGRRTEEVEVDAAEDTSLHGADRSSREGSVGDVHEVGHGRVLCLLSLGGGEHAGGAD